MLTKLERATGMVCRPIQTFQAGMNVLPMSSSRESAAEWKATFGKHGRGGREGGGEKGRGRGGEWEV